VIFTDGLPYPRSYGSVSVVSDTFIRFFVENQEEKEGPRNGLNLGTLIRWSL
jgi:hypothetical protein